MRLSDFIQGVGQPFPYYPAIAKLIGVKECIFLCRLIWWTGMEKAGDGWIYKTQLDFQNETGMSFDEQSNARKNLKRLGLLEERHQRLQHKMFYKVNLEALNDKWEASAPIPETGKPGFGESENPVSSEPANPVSSNTTEETQKRPTKNAAPAAAASFAKVFVEGWSAAYEADRGVKYVFGGAKDGSAVKRLAATGVSSADLLTMARKAWKQRGKAFFYCEKVVTIATFAAFFNQVRAELSARSVGPVGARVATAAQLAADAKTEF